MADTELTSVPRDAVPAARRGAEPGPTPPPLGQLLEQLAEDAGVLVRQEIELAKSEVRSGVRGAIAATVAMATAAALLFLALLVLVAFLVLALGVLLDGAYWLSALIIGGLTMLAGLVVARIGAKRLAAIGLTPENTLYSVRESSEWLRAEVTALRKGKE